MPFQRPHRLPRPLTLRLRLVDAALALLEGAAIAWAFLESAGIIDKLILTYNAGPE